MTTPCRLLFAAARGARLQKYEPKWHGWCDTDERPDVGGEADYRIHPDDLQLQYGPVSTELRDAAALPEIRWLQDVLSD